MQIQTQQGTPYQDTGAIFSRGADDAAQAMPNLFRRTGSPYWRFWFTDPRTGQGIDRATQSDDIGKPSGDVFNPLFTSSASKNGSGVNGTTQLLTAWIDSPEIAKAYPENTVTVFDSPTSPTHARAVDYSMTNALTGAYFSVAQGWGGTKGTAQAAHYQTALAKGIYSLFCNDSDKIEFDAPLTAAMMDRLQYCALLDTVKVKTDALHDYVVTGVKFNPWSIERKVHVTAIRSV